MAHVDLNARYQSARREANIRITQRQNSLYIFLAISLGIVGFAFGERSSKPADLDGSGYIIRALITLAVPLAAIMLGWLNQKHDETIALLRFFLSECEKQDADETLARLSYNARASYRSYADRFRQNHNKAFGVSIATICAMAFILFLLSFYAALGSDNRVIVFLIAYALLYFSGVSFAIKVVMKQPEFDRPPGNFP
jgi:hypothetical protein